MTRCSHSAYSSVQMGLVSVPDYSHVPFESHAVRRKFGDRLSANCLGFFFIVILCIIRISVSCYIYSMVLNSVDVNATHAAVPWLTVRGQYSTITQNNTSRTIHHEAVSQITHWPTLIFWIHFWSNLSYPKII